MEENVLEDLGDHVSIDITAQVPVENAQPENVNINDFGLFQCHECEVVKDTKRKLRDHIHYHHKEPTLCLHCPKTFPSKEKANQHMQGVHDTKNYALCAQCGKQFSRHFGLERHVKTVHSL